MLEGKWSQGLQKLLSQFEYHFTLRGCKLCILVHETDDFQNKVK